MRSARPHFQAHLRTQAEDRLRSGTAPATRGWHTGAPILGVLHGLASVPASASDALKLLHELQVHQVELDLQQEQVDQAHQHLAEALATYTTLFQLAPFGYLLLNAAGEFIDVNLLGAACLGLAPGDDHEAWLGRRIHDCLTPESQLVVQDVLLRLSQGGGRETFTVHAAADGSPLQGAATGLPGGRRVLLAFMPAAGV